MDVSTSSRLSRRAGAPRAPQSERGLDLYPTPPCATLALLRAEPLPHTLWEPAAGRGDMVRVLRDAGHAVIASDIVQYDFSLHFVGDFLTQTKAPVGTQAIVTNPSFSIAQRFIEHALELCPLVIVLLPLSFLTSARRAPLIEASALARVHVFVERLPMMHRDGWTGRRASSRMSFGWFLWQRGHRGPPTLHRISIRNEQGDQHRTPLAKCPPPRLATDGSGPIVSTTEEAFMTAKTEIRAVEIEEGSPIPKPSGFDLEKFRSKRDVAMANVGTLATGLPHHNLAGARDFVRLHPDEAAYWSPELCFVNVPIKGQKRDTLHLIEEDLAVEYVPSGRVQRFRLALATKPHNVFFLCQVPTRNLENSWNACSVRACEKAKEVWLQATSRKEEGVDAYKIDYARDPDAFPEPEWPQQSLPELIGVTFAGRTIDHADHPAILRLIGAKQQLT